MELHITQGYSKDHRPDLAQATLQLICDNLSGIPIYMEALDGNSNDRIKGNSELTGYARDIRRASILGHGRPGFRFTPESPAYFAPQYSLRYLLQSEHMAT